MKDSSDRFRPLKTPGAEAAAGMDAQEEQKKRIASYIDRMTGFIGDTPEEKYQDALEAFRNEQFAKLSPEKQTDMRTALLAIGAKWETAYANQEAPNPVLERIYARSQEFKRWIEGELGSTH